MTKAIDDWAPIIRTREQAGDAIAREAQATCCPAALPVGNAGEQLTPGAPWRVLLTAALKGRLNTEPGEGYLPIREAIKALGVSRQTVLQRVKRDELEPVHVTRGWQEGLPIKVLAPGRALRSNFMNQGAVCKGIQYALDSRVEHPVHAFPHDPGMETSASCCRSRREISDLAGTARHSCAPRQRRSRTKQDQANTYCAQRPWPAA